MKINSGIQLHSTVMRLMAVGSIDKGMSKPTKMTGADLESMVETMPGAPGPKELVDGKEKD